MKNDDRHIQFFDLTMVGKTRATNLESTRAPSPRTLGQLIGDLDKLQKAGNAIQLRKIKGRDVEYRLQDIGDDPNYHILLINVVDTGAAAPVTQKISGAPQDRQLSTINAQRGLESSAHLLISKIPDDAGKYLVLFEKNTSLNFGDVRRFLNYVAIEASKAYVTDYSSPHPDGSKKTIRFFCHLELLGHPSDEFMDELANGKLTGISITVGLNEIKTFDSTKQPELKTAEIKVSIDGASVQAQGGNSGFFNRIRALAGEINGELIRIKFRDEKENNHSVNIDPTSGHILNNDQYVKKGKISNFANRLATSHTQIDNSIIQKMIALA